MLNKPQLVFCGFNTYATMYFKNHVKQKTINIFCFNKSKHNAINKTCFLNQIKKYKTSAWFVLNHVQNTIMFSTHVKQSANNT